MGRLRNGPANRNSLELQQDVIHASDLPRGKSAAENRFDAQNIEVVSGNEIAPNALVVAVVAQAGNDHSVHEQPGKDVVPIAVIFVIQVRLKGEISAVM